MSAQPEAWLRGPVAGVPTALQPVAHALLQALEDVEHLASGATEDDLWTSPGGAATAGFHIVHAAGSLDRLLTYARGEQLDDAQRGSLAAERALPRHGSAELVSHFHEAVARAFAQLRATDPATLDDARAVGRGALPSTVRGLLHHAGEHTARHAGQLRTTLRIVRGLRAGATAR